MVARHAVRINGLDDIAVTKLDILDGMERLKICTAYRVRGATLQDFPADIEALAQCEPVYEELPGWRESTANVTSAAGLPTAARRYLARISELLEVPIALVSIGSQRRQAFRMDEGAPRGARSARAA